MKKYLLFLPLLLLATSALSQGSGIQWFTNPASENVVNYHVWDHVGAVFNLLATVPQPAPPIATATWYPNLTLPGGTTHLLSISAINTQGVESPRSVDLNFPIPSTPAKATVVP